MSPRWTPDFAGARATMRVYERGDYELKVGKPKGFVKEVTKDGKQVVQSGVRYGLEMVGKIQADGTLDREFEGEQVPPFTCWLHSEGGWGIAKRFIMAALGYDITPAAETEFDAEAAATLDFNFEGDVDEEIVLGDGWLKPSGNRIIATLDKRKSDDPTDTREFQQHSGILPIRTG